MIVYCSITRPILGMQKHTLEAVWFFLQRSDGKFADYFREAKEKNFRTVSLVDKRFPATQPTPVAAAQQPEAPDGDMRDRESASVGGEAKRQRLDVTVELTPDSDEATGQLALLQEPKVESTVPEEKPTDDVDPALIIIEKTEELVQTCLQHNRDAMAIPDDDVDYLFESPKRMPIRDEEEDDLLDSAQEGDLDEVCALDCADCRQLTKFPELCTASVCPADPDGVCRYFPQNHRCPRRPPRTCRPRSSS
eukprot:TRINITY_DN10079_c0_g1_i1.p1 TRINITY_DN10079_c0_g1~~TRINITY_DN10079_c0_g1_i1.p1  ORF type:complete len:250 (-),score=41.96 TRINITY_DN10079_c0_g1_i1:56-805(-)